MAWGLANSLTDAVPRSRSARILRRVPSASAEKMPSSVSSFKLTIRLSIELVFCPCQCCGYRSFPRVAGRITVLDGEKRDGGAPYRVRQSCRFMAD